MATRGRKPVEINVRDFQDTVLCLEAEAGGSFPNRSQLWAAVAATEWAASLKPRPLTAQTAMLKAEALKLNIHTPKGRKGDGLRQVIEQEKAHPETRKKRSRRNRKMPADAVNALRKWGGEQYKRSVERTIGGSLKAAIKLKCLDCCCFQKKEIALCSCVSCPLWNFRPYKDASRLEDDVEDRVSLVVV